jgi:hypothetical protein
LDFWGFQHAITAEFELAKVEKAFFLFLGLPI